jgi:hypothetical protein
MVPAGEPRLHSGTFGVVHHQVYIEEKFGMPLHALQIDLCLTGQQTLGLSFFTNYDPGLVYGRTWSLHSSCEA